MRNIQKCMIMGLFLVLASSVAGLSQGAPAFIGTWKFNPQKSKMNLSLPPRSLVRKYEDRGGGVYIFMQEGFDAAGAKMFSMYVAKDDGSKYPLVIEGADNLSQISVKATDAYTAEQQEGGTPPPIVPAARGAAAAAPPEGGGGGGGGTKATRVVSKDGKTLTITVRPNVVTGAAAAQRESQGTDPNEVNVMVFDRLQ